LYANDVIIGLVEFKLSSRASASRQCFEALMFRDIACALGIRDVCAELATRLCVNDHDDKRAEKWPAS